MIVVSTWVVLALVVWFVIALPVGVVIGRAMRLADNPQPMGDARGREVQQP